MISVVVILGYKYVVFVQERCTHHTQRPPDVDERHRDSHHFDQAESNLGWLLQNATRLRVDHGSNLTDKWGMASDDGERFSPNDTAVKQGHRPSSHDCSMSRSCARSFHRSI